MPLARLRLSPKCSQSSLIVIPLLSALFCAATEHGDINEKINLPISYFTQHHYAYRLQ